ncbi:MAG: HpcH/HpaI aldolase/citrate lyase family protein [Sphingomonadales bacterium]|nr:HpcH/HpaI aldolase/citrate lyase family protein [Sphingomonadales bacterium]NCQ20678.1 HpcH/HpaI aldolase/citrate lyase family protein [Sphingomonadales bacterium]NCT04813.1 HpcH/HpaI aldolase/citrate lyase family protein [Sphingomonadales bacterium]
MTKAVELGATLYIPVQHPRLADVLAGANPDLRSVVICLEDSLHEADVGAAQEVFSATLQSLTEAPPQLIAYARPRNPAMLTWMQAQPGIERLAGFVLPKITTGNLPDWLARLETFTHGIMPTIESAEAFDRMALARMAAVLQPFGERVHAVRIGGNDILNLLGVRRSRERTAYDGPLGLAIATMASVFLPEGMALSAPVFEHYAQSDLLREEVARDIDHGLLTKTAIHPMQVGIIHDALRPSASETDEARAILAREARAVFGHGGSMCEPTTHARWAAGVLDRAAVHGLRGAAPGVPAQPTQAA